MMASRRFYGNIVRLSSLCGWAFIGRTVSGDISLSWMIKQKANEHKKSKQSAKGATNAAGDNFGQMWDFRETKGVFVFKMAKVYDPDLRSHELA